MKKHIFKINVICALGISAVMLSGCFKNLDNFGNLNSNPNATTAPNTAALLTNSINVLIPGPFGHIMDAWDQGGVNTICGEYAQYFSETQYPSSSRYERTPVNFDFLYYGLLYDLQNIINYNSDPTTAPIAASNGNNASQIGVARILKAYFYWIMTDTWGDIPYSKALKGDGLIPYDSQDVIYKDLFKELKEASAQLIDQGVQLKGDILFSGNLTKWKRFANSLRILMALRVSKVDAAMGKAEFTAAMSDPAGIVDDVNGADDVKLVPPGGNYQNAFYNYYVVVQRKDYAESKTMTDILSSSNDERINAFGSSSVGFPFGVTRDSAVIFSNLNTNWARIIEPSRRTETTPLVWIAADQIKLARAEASALGWSTENMATLYSDAIMSNWKRWGVYDATKFAAYMSQANIALGVNNIQKIAMQRWIGFYPNGAQGFAEWRRNGIPALIPAPGQTQIPRRVVYGTNEPAYNPTNYQVAADKYKDQTGPDSQFGKVWWDK